MKKKYNLTVAQNGVLYDFDDNGNVVFTNKNFIWGHLKINQKVDFNKLIEALNYCFKKHDSLRIKLCKENDKLLQYFENYEEQNIEIINVKSDEDVKRIECDIIDSPFEMFNSLLFKAIIYKYENDFGGVFIKLSHVIADGYTLGLLLYEVLGYYTKTLRLIISFSYLNYIKSEEKYPLSKKYIQDKKYWHKMFETGVPATVSFPSNKENYSLSKANKLIFNLDNSITRKINCFCKGNGITNTTFYMSIFAIYIYKKTKFTNFFLSTSNMNRRTIKEKLMAGMSTKIAYFIVKIQNESFMDFTKRIRTSLKSSYKHMRYINNYTRDLFEQYNDNRLLPTNVILSYQNIKMDTDHMNVKFEIDGDNNVGTYGSDLVSIHIFEYKNNVKIIYDYLLEKYSIDDIKNINDSIISIIEQIIIDNNICIQNIKV